MARFRTWVEIDENALGNNIIELKSLLRPGTRFCAVVKANAYGHGLNQVVRTSLLKGVDAFAVDNINEALKIRKISVSALVIILNYVLYNDLEEAIQNDFHLTVFDSGTIQKIEELSSKLATKTNIHLKLDTGLHRQGVLLENLGDYLSIIKKSSHINLAGVSTHFAKVNDPNDTNYSIMQCELFERALDVINKEGFNPRWIHCSKSATTILYPDTHGTLVRPGIALYGIWPTTEIETAVRKQGIKCYLRPILSWKTRIAQIKSVNAGSGIGYGLTETVNKNSRIAILPIGYFDGYDRGLSSVGEVLVGGYRCKVLGEISMNITTIDVSSVPNLEKEQEVILLGRSGRNQMTADRIAKKINTTPYEIVTRINPDIPRIVVNNQRYDKSQ